MPYPYANPPPPPGMSAGEGVGIALGALCLLGLLAAPLVVIRRRRQRQQQLMHLVASERLNAGLLDAEGAAEYHDAAQGDTAQPPPPSEA